MDYEKKYKDAIERAKRMFSEKEINYLFPELKESEDENTKKEIINYLECQRRDEPSRKDTHNKWISYIEKHALSKDDYDFLRDCARVLKTFGWQSYANRLTGLCPALGEEAKAMMSIPIFPKESGDERIRNRIIDYLKVDLEEHPEREKRINEMLAWLEKQGEQKPTDKVESKFHEGDWVIYKNDICKIVKREEGCNKLVTNFGIEKELVNERNLSTARLWTIQDAKNGDVLCAGQIILLFKQWEDDADCNFAIAHAGIDISGKLQITNKHWLISNESKPATKEQREQLEKVMADAGYTFDFEKKELKKIEDKSLVIDEGKSEMDYCFTKMMNGEKVNSTWSEEDEKMVKDIIAAIDTLYYHGMVNWLKSLKYRVQPKQEWSEEDEEEFQIAIDTLDKAGQHDSAHWFKSLKERYSWKPSDKQIYTLEQWLKDNRYKGDERYCYPIFDSLYQDLKKLK
jgi:hypothetical protein